MSRSRRRPALILALVAPLGLAGCHAGGAQRLAKPAPAPVATRETVSKERFIALHNRNAQAIRSIDASPQLEVNAGGEEHSVKGKLAMERPGNFALVIRKPMSTQEMANIGSNAEGFWFFVRDNEDRGIYTCAHADVSASPLTATFQPDWIIEALGLRVIDPAEARVIDARPGDKPGELVLTQLRKDAHGEMLTKETVVDEADGKIREHRLYRGAKAQLLAKATIHQYETMSIDSPDPAKPAATVHYPSRYRLEWVEEKLALNVTMSQPTLNREFAAARKAVIFHEPKVPGYKRIDLAALPQADRASAGGASSSRIHETRPVPRSGSGSGSGGSVRLGDPQALGDGAMRTSAEPLALGLNTGADPDRPLGVVGAPLPRPADPVPPVASPSGSNRLRSPSGGR